MRYFIAFMADLDAPVETGVLLGGGLFLLTVVMQVCLLADPPSPFRLSAAA
eukprot:SAG22_NODE_9093_length_610_cov_1.136986_1_plen_51_part_00